MSQLEKENNSLCVCIPTFNRSLIIADFLENCASYYLDAGIDIYIYDSSTDDMTKDMVEKWENDNKDRVYYVSMPSEMHANIKVYKIWQFYGWRKKYDFVWICSDALQLTKDAVSTILYFLKSEYDLIELDLYDQDSIGVKLYLDQDKLFSENAWKMTMFGTTILNVHTFLCNVDWNNYENKYLKTNTISYSHISFYFNRMLELPDFKCMHLPLKKNHKMSRLKKTSGWKKSTFIVICVEWVETIKMLPECYADKYKVILDLASNSVLRNKCSFWELKRENIYGLDIFLCYLNIWKKVTKVKIGSLFRIAILPYNIGSKLENLKLIRKLRIVIKPYNYLYLYGAGVVGERYGKYLFQNNIEYKGYLVTRIYDDQKMINNHEIKEIDKLERSKNVGIIIAVSENISDEVIAELKKRGYENQVFYSSELSDWIRLYMQDQREG